jgi:hypothetical protein
MGVRGNFDWSREDERPEDTRLFIERMEKEKQEIKNK